MSEEIMAAAGDLATVEQLRAEVKALRSLEQLDQALSVMSVDEIDSARARIDSALVPQLARMLALCLIKDDGELYNVVTWALGSADPLGEMELILQRTEGKTPTQLRIEAEAHALALQSELDAAREVVQAIEAGINRDGYCPICFQTESVTLQTGYYTHHDGCALAAYQELTKANDHA